MLCLPICEAGDNIYCLALHPCDDFDDGKDEICYRRVGLSKWDKKVADRFFPWPRKQEGVVEHNEEEDVSESSSSPKLSFENIDKGLLQSFTLV